MKILGINSSPRGKNSRTLKLVEAVLDGARQKGAETELVDICKLDIRYCLGCQVCYATGKCIQEDDLSDLWDKILSSDGVVIGSPVYINGVTAQLKTMIDRLADAIHCQMLLGKYGCAVTTAGGSGDKEVLNYMKYFLNQLGVLTVGDVGAVIGRNPSALDAAIGDAVVMGQTLAAAIQKQRHYPNQERVLVERREYFRQLVEANKEAWAHQYDYWMEKGWM
jgi:multimeric flavodoxin WrbA